MSLVNSPTNRSSSISTLDSRAWASSAAAMLDISLECGSGPLRSGGSTKYPIWGIQNTYSPTDPFAFRCWSRWLEVMDFSSSTHRKHWLFTKETLRESGGSSKTQAGWKWNMLAAQKYIQQGHTYLDCESSCVASRAASRVQKHGCCSKQATLKYGGSVGGKKMF